MTTDSIKERTLEITKAYLSLSEEIDGLSLQDFLLIRESAVKELNGIIKATDSDSSSESSEKRVIMAKAPKVIKEEPAKVSKRPSEKLGKVQILPQRTPTEETEDEPEEEIEDSPRPLSKFEMLRAFPDEWN